jgi:hypothetical protein
MTWLMWRAPRRIGLIRHEDAGGSVREPDVQLVAIIVKGLSRLD